MLCAAPSVSRCRSYALGAAAPFFGVVLAACSVLWLGVTVPASAAAQTAKGSLSVDAAERKGLVERYGKALEQELGLLKALDQLDRDASVIESRIVKLATERATATDTLVAAEDARAKAERELESMRQATRARLRAILRIAHLPTLRFALSAKDFSESVVKDRLLRRLLAADRVRLATYRARLTDLEQLTRQRDVAVQKLNALDLELHAQKAKGEQERRDKVALLAQIEEDRKYQERAARDLDAAHKQLSAQIVTLKEWSERKYTFALTQGKLLPPVQGRVETGFGEVRHPRFGTVTLHRGLAYRAGNAQGIAVRAVFWGRVAHVGWLTGYGETVILDHGRGWHTIYAHLENVRVNVGDLVPARARIADVGQSGSLRGRYLYVEIRHNGLPVDPGTWFR